jgi:RNA polymerase sigma factor (sigma-70 family)
MNVRKLRLLKIAMATPTRTLPTSPEHSDDRTFQHLLAERIARLPELQKKVLAMYYYENMQLPEIAAIFGVTESRICQIRRQAVATCSVTILAGARGSKNHPPANITHFFNPKSLRVPF